MGLELIGTGGKYSQWASVHSCIAAPCLLTGSNMAAEFCCLFLVLIWTTFSGVSEFTFIL